MAFFPPPLTSDVEGEETLLPVPFPPVPALLEGERG